MKKIMGAVLAAAMLAGIATASDVGFSYKGSNYFNAGGDKGRQLRYDGLSRKDCLAVSVTTEAAGIVVDFNTKQGSIAADEYYGWLNFGLPLGSLQLTGGAWNGRYVNRVLTDKFDLDKQEFELFKPGVINGTFGEDSDNLTNGNLGLVAAWTLADALPGTLMVKLGIARYYDEDWNMASTLKTKGYQQSAKKTDWLWNPDKNSFGVGAGFTGEVAYRQEGAFSANFAVRSLNRYSYSFGAWISPDVSDVLQLTVGGTVATGKTWMVPASADGTGGWSDRKTEWGIDFRLRLQVTDDLSITTMNNLSSGINEKDNGHHEGMLWNMLNATYAFADNLTASFTVQSVADVFCPVPHRQGQNWKLIMSPSLIVQASERVRVSTSVRATMPNIKDYALKQINLTIPVIFTFNY